MAPVCILALSDTETPAVYSHRIRDRFGKTDLAVSCGDLPFYYLEYVISTLNIRLYYVNGNHVLSSDDEGNAERNEYPWGAINLHGKSIYDQEHDLILAGIEGSLVYNNGRHQYSQLQMWQFVLKLVPQLIRNRIRYGRYLDVFVTHAAPKGIHDDFDPAHQGVDAFLWLIRTFKPRYHLHGHMHHYNPLQESVSQYGKTRVINTYGYREIRINSETA